MRPGPGGIPMPPPRMPNGAPFNALGQPAGQYGGPPGQYAAPLGTGGILPSNAVSAIHPGGPPGGPQQNPNGPQHAYQTFMGAQGVQRQQQQPGYAPQQQPQGPGGQQQQQGQPGGPPPQMGGNPLSRAPTPAQQQQMQQQQQQQAQAQAQQQAAAAQRSRTSTPAPNQPNGGNPNAHPSPIRGTSVARSGSAIGLGPQMTQQQQQTDAALQALLPGRPAAAAQQQALLGMNRQAPGGIPAGAVRSFSGPNGMNPYQPGPVMHQMQQEVSAAIHAGMKRPGTPNVSQGMV